MGNLILKPATSGQLILQDEGGDSALSIDTSGNTTLAGTANNIGTVTSGTFNGTIGDSAVLSDSYYLQAKLDNTFASDTLPLNINFDESTSPYWVFTSDSDWHVSGTGSNFSKGTTISDLKIHRAGIYAANFSVTAYELNPDVERAIDISIRGVGSGSTSEKARSIDQIATTGETGGNYGSATASLIYKFNANDQINFYISSSSGGSANIYSLTHFNICLIRPL